MEKHLGTGRMPALKDAEQSMKKIMQKKDEMRNHPLYQYYPVKGVPNLGAREGYFENLAMYCGMAYDANDNLEPRCSDGVDNSLLV